MTNNSCVVEVLIFSFKKMSAHDLIHGHGVTAAIGKLII